MKHIFVVHSNLTYLSALGVICKERLPLQDVVVISDMYVREEPVKCHYIDIKRPLKAVFQHPNKVLRPFKYVDKKIGELIGHEDFILYVTAFFSLQRICVSHPLCKQFHFIEEGLSNYCDTLPLTAITAGIDELRLLRSKSLKYFLSDFLLLVKGYSAKIQALPFLYSAYLNTQGVKFFGFDENAYVGIRDVSVLDMRLIRENFKFESKYNFEDSHIWLGTAVVITKLQELGDYIAAIEAGCIQRLKADSVKHIYIKFHPVECETSRKETISLFRKYDIEITVLEDELVLELELMNALHVTIWGVDSSLMFYAAKLGLRCNSIIKYLNGYLEYDIPVYWNVVHKLS